MNKIIVGFLKADAKGIRTNLELLENALNDEGLEGLAAWDIYGQLAENIGIHAKAIQTRSDLNLRKLEEQAAREQNT